MNQTVNNNKNKNKHSSNSLVFGRWPKTKMGFSWIKLNHKFVWILNFQMINSTLGNITLDCPISTKSSERLIDEVGQGNVSGPKSL